MVGVSHPNICHLVEYFKMEHAAYQVKMSAGTVVYRRHVRYEAISKRISRLQKDLEDDLIGVDDYIKGASDNLRK